MGIPFIPGTPSWAGQLPATSFGTVLFCVIPPGPNNNGVPFMLGPAPGAGGHPNWWKEGSYTHVTELVVTSSTTQNLITIQRPLNWTTLSAAMAKNTTAISLTDDPGVYSTNYRYPLPNQSWNPPGTVNTTGYSPPLADNALAANDYICFQLADGSWHVSMIASGTVAGANVVMTTATPNYVLATAPAGTPVFWFGISTDTEPYTRAAHLFFTPPATSYRVNLIGGWGGNTSAVGGAGAAASPNGVANFFPGEPMLVYNPNASATTTVDLITADYRKY